MKIVDCKLTNSTSNILQQFRNSPASRYEVYPVLSSGICVSGSCVYSVSSGKVVRISEDPEMPKFFVVTIHCGADVFFQYRHLSEVHLKLNSAVDLGTYVGSCNSFVQLEFIHSKQSIWPVRILSNTYYKHDPQPILESGYYQNTEYASNFAMVGELMADVDSCLPESVIRMLSNNLGE